MPFRVAIVGRPNVGKSTLFNRLVGKRLALVDDTPGVTRDRREGEAHLGDLAFTVFDTAGLEEAFDDSLEGRMRAQTARAVEEADMVLLLIDARAGVTPLDEHFGRWLRARDIPVRVVANKCEGRAGADGLAESYALGLGEPVPVSAEHGEGMADLYEALRPFVDAAAKTDGAAPDAPEDGDDDEPRELQLAIVGRPNVGKSTLVNRLIGEDRMLTGPEAGITRDSIAIGWTWKDKPVRLVDTAGLRRKSRVSAKLETLSAAETLRSIRFAQVVVLLLDARDMLEKQDLTIARMVIDEGRALVIAVNKWDTVDNRQEALARLHDRLETSLPQVRGIPVVTLSALTGKGVERLLPKVFDIYEVWNRRVSTARLNDWLAAVVDEHPPPLSKGRRIKLRYMTQAKTRPPTFVVFASQPKALPEGYLRYLANGLRDVFKLEGVPLRLYARGGKNPYAPGKARR